ncbi:unnamed protein product [Didymodactylos carnosus]|uniref:Uncharacterized protein n=1 Tax=Didymodactylos carnosus TaxID=1234261 RepID=A0A814HZQ3_9BILA|nr:unnamed protein product [Didymodactylos carnosus]CAF1018369.1 unnamed protein product [Didymodactylos carnosus]CAF3615872.1 unnamed protein product [Didymodactylos carnosus]CAF3789872.1 unnamed protein product [Didymodactylos carnosus]
MTIPSSTSMTNTDKLKKINLYQSKSLQEKMKKVTTISTTTASSSSTSNLTKKELKKLKSLLPTLKRKSSSSPIEIVMETIRYIRELEEQLIDRFMETDLNTSNVNSIIHQTGNNQSDNSDTSSLSDISDTILQSSSAHLTEHPLRDIGNSE